MPKPQVRGGAKYRQWLRTAKQAKIRSVKGVDVGFFQDARYPPVHTGKNRKGQKRTPHYVATVAGWQEFGTSRGVQERPFFRNAIQDAGGRKGPLVAILVNAIDPKTMVFDAKTAGKLGATMQGLIQRSITTLRDPPNAPATIKAKGSSNPLLDNEFLRSSVSWRIDR